MKFSYPEPTHTDRPEPESPVLKSTMQNDAPAGGAAVIARVISWLLLPPFVPVYGILLIFGLSLLSLEPGRFKTLFSLVTFGLCSLLPILCGLILKMAGMISDPGLNVQRERPIPYMIIAVCTGGNAVFMALHGMPAWVTAFYAGGAVAALVCLAVNFKWKISAHCAAMGGLTAMLFAVQRYGMPQHPLAGWIIAAILASGLLASCRLYLRRHTLWQTIAGWGTGFICVWLASLLIH